MIKDCRIVPVGFTDHALVLCDVIFKEVAPRSAYWHFNSALISDKGCKEVLSFFGVVLEKQKVILRTLGSGGIMVRFKLSFCASSILSMSLST